MKTFSSKEAKDNFGELIDTAQRGPVEIQKKGRPVAVVISLEEFKRLEAFEDKWWANQAQKALQEGMLTQGESEELLNKISNAQD